MTSLAATAVGLTLASLPVAPAGGSTLPAPNHQVYVFGDSVLLGTVRTLPAALPGWRVHMECVGSRRLPQLIPILRTRIWRAGTTVVIQMGNNYIPGEGGTFRSQIDRTMWILRNVRRVVWVTVAEKWSSRVTINAAIRAAALRYPRIRIADWAKVIKLHPSYAFDGLHLTTTGRLAISRLIAARVTGY